MAAISLLPEGRRLAPCVSWGPLTVAFGARAQAGTRAAWRAVPPRPGTVGLSEAFHTTGKGYSVWSGSQELHVSDKLDITLPLSGMEPSYWQDLKPADTRTSGLWPGPLG